MRQCNFPSTWPSSLSVASHWFPQLLVSTRHGGFVMFSGTMRWSSLSRTTCVFFWPMRSFQCDIVMWRCRAVFTRLCGLDFKASQLGIRLKAQCLSISLSPMPKQTRSAADSPRSQSWKDRSRAGKDVPWKNTTDTLPSKWNTSGAFIHKTSESDLTELFTSSKN